MSDFKHGHWRPSFKGLADKELKLRRHHFDSFTSVTCQIVCEKPPAFYGLKEQCLLASGGNTVVLLFYETT